MSASKKLATTLANAATEETNPNAWDISYAYYDAQSAAWDLSKLFYVSRDTSISNWDTYPTDVFFSTDGTQMYLLGDQGNTVDQYSLTEPYNVWYISYVQSFSTGSQDGVPEGIFFDSTGTKLYVCGGATARIFRYDLSTAWDISTASYSDAYFSVYNQETNPLSVHFSPDGTKMYVSGFGGSGTVYEYDLSTAWDVTSASYSQSFSVASQEGAPYGLRFSTDGTKMVVIGSINDSLYEYDLSTAWDVSTASYSGNTVSVTSQETTPEGFYIDPHGGHLIYTGSFRDKIWQWAFGGYYVAEEYNPKGVTFNSDGTKFYVVGTAYNDVKEYNLSTEWDVNTASYSQAFSISSQDTNSQGLTFSADGTKMYVIGIGNWSVYQYNLSTAWDVSTASYAQSFVVSSQDIYPLDLCFKPDGTKMYVAGNQNDSVYEYDLSTAWDVSTASYSSKALSAGSYETSPYGVAFSSDGTKVYVVGGGSDKVHQFTLSTAWDISTGTYDTYFPIMLDGTPQGITWKPDGTIFYAIGSNTDRVLAYSIAAE